MVQEYKRLLTMREQMWSSSVRHAVEACESAFFRDAIVARPDKFLQGNGFLERLQDVQIGHIMMNGRVDRDVQEEDAEWDSKGIYSWRAA